MEKQRLLLIDIIKEMFMGVFRRTKYDEFIKKRYKKFDKR